ncbi:MAG TPA: hypothetical protein VM533_08350 [Fimbriiglobus sp.]|jgi:hypothetical protein|nr:hypothetical protein [Fimbriiglobus sp.]
MNKVLTRYADCPACGLRHRFLLPLDDPVSQEYGYVCPRTGRPASVTPWGEWLVLRFPPTGVITLLPLGTVSICTPTPSAPEVGLPAATVIAASPPVAVG